MEQLCRLPQLISAVNSLLAWTHGWASNLNITCRNRFSQLIALCLLTICLKIDYDPSNREINRAYFTGEISLPFILEGIVTTLNQDGSINVAPMGPIVELGDKNRIRRFLFRPFQDSQTCRNLIATKQGVFHLSDDVLLLARAVTKQLSGEDLSLKPAKTIKGKIIGNACQWYEFHIVSCDTESTRAELEAEILHQAGTGCFLGFNRAKNAIIETAILATRLHLLKNDFVQQELERFQIIIEKTGGDQECEAFGLLTDFISAYREDEL